MRKAIVVVGLLASACFLLIRPDPDSDVYLVESVSDDLVIDLRDGPPLELAGIDVPYPVTNPRYVELVTFARKWLVGEVVRVDWVAERGQSKGYVLILRLHPSLFFNAGVVGEGYARVDRASLKEPWTQSMLSAEQEARRKAAGIWGEAPEGVAPRSSKTRDLLGPILGTTALVVGTIACGVVRPDPNQAWERVEATYRPAMSEAYPRGTSRSVVLKQHGGRQRWECSLDDEHDVFLRISLSKLLPEKPSGCDVLVVSRGVTGSSVGAAGIYLDYAFYDGDDRVLITYRRLID